MKKIVKSIGKNAGVIALCLSLVIALFLAANLLGAGYNWAADKYGFHGMTYDTSTQWDGDYMRVHWHPGHQRVTEGAVEWRVRDESDEWSEWRITEVQPLTDSLWLGPGYVERAKTYDVEVRQIYGWKGRTE